MEDQLKDHLNMVDNTTNIKFTYEEEFWELLVKDGYHQNTGDTFKIITKWMEEQLKDHLNTVDNTANIKFAHEEEFGGLLAKDGYHQNTLGQV